MPKELWREKYLAPKPFGIIGTHFEENSSLLPSPFGSFGSFARGKIPLFLFQVVIFCNILLVPISSSINSNNWIIGIFQPSAN
jgi:hypothetical protein